MAEKYGMLPHQVEADATTYDFMVTDVLATYDKYMENKAKGGLMDHKLYGLTTEELIKIKNKKKDVKQQR